MRFLLVWLLVWMGASPSACHARAGLPVAPVAGLPIQVSRTYDSREATSGHQGDFGVGWTLDLNNIRVQKNGVVGGTDPDPKWQQVRAPGTFFPGYTVRANKPRVVTITFPGDRVYSFRAAFDPEQSEIGRTQAGYVVWRPQPGTKGTLTAGAGEEDYAEVYDASPPGVVLSTEYGSDFDQHEWVLSLPDGRKFGVREGSARNGGGLQWVRDLNGNMLYLSRNGISSVPAGAATPARRVLFVRDGSGRITRIQDARGNSVFYNSEGNNDLTSVTDRESNTTRFTYDQKFAHYLKDVIDPRGPSFVPIRNFYDANGRLEHSEDANGKPIHYEHDMVDDANGRREIVTDRLGHVSVMGYDDYGNVTRSERLPSPQDAANGVLPVVTASTYNLTSDNPEQPTSTTVYPNGPDQPGLTTTYSYDAQGNMTGVKEPFMGAQTMSYTNGRLDQQRDAHGVLVLDNDYDGKGRLNQSQVPWKRDAQGNLLYASTRYVFDDSNPSSVPNRVIDAENHETRFGYNANTGNVTSVTRVNAEAAGQDAVSEFGYDPNGNKTSATIYRTIEGVRQAITSNTGYDKQDRPTVTLSPLGVAEGGQSRTVYNAIGKVEASTRADGTGAAQTTLYHYDELGRRDWTQASDGSVTRTEYNDNDQATRSFDRTGRSSVTEYDSLGRAFKTASRAANGQWITATGTSTDPAQALYTQTLYDGAGRALKSRDERGHWSETLYDDANRAVTRRDFVSDALDPEALKNGQVSTASQALTSTTVSDALGRTDTSVDSRGTCTKYLYDEAGRTTHTIGGLTQAQAQAIASPGDIPAGAIVSFSEYDDLGRAIRQVNPSGLWKAMGYDSMGRLASVTQPIDADASHNQVTRFGYDEAGMKLWQQDAAQHSTRFGYDVAGRMLWRQMPGGQTERMGYNARGQVSSKSDFRQMVTTMTYDERGRMLTQVPDARLGEPALSYQYPDEFTSVSTRGSGTNALSTIRRMDPDRGWLSSVQTPNGALAYSYDGASGQRTGVSELNASGQAVFTNGYSYDELGRLKQVATATAGLGSTPQVLASYGYDQNGNREAVLRANGVASAYSYDALNRLRTLRHFKGALTLSNYGYDVRSDGKRRGVQEDLFNADLLPDGSQRATNRSVGFGYDGAGRLIGESGSDGRGIAYENSWQYDAAGNRVGETYRRATSAAPTTFSSTTTIAAQFNANDWLLSQSSSTTNAGGTTSTYGTTFGYDDNGSQTGQSSNGGAAQINAWDFQGQLAGVSTQGTTAPHTRYATDAGGNRLSVTTGIGSASPKTSSFLTDPNTSYAQVLAQHDSDGEEARWVWEESLAPLTMTRGGRTFFYLADGQDSVRQLTDESGKVTDSYHYDAWGNALAGGSGTTKNPFRYTGQQMDQDGKYFLRARYYNSGTGRFLSQDPVMGSESDPISLHRYLYAGDDAVNFVDPTGNSAEGLSGTVAALSIGAILFTMPQAANAPGPNDVIVHDSEADYQKRLAANVGLSAIFGWAFRVGGQYIAGTALGKAFSGAVSNFYQKSIRWATLRAGASASSGAVSDGVPWYRLIKRWTPVDKGPLGTEFPADTFRTSTYNEVLTTQDTVIWRVWGTPKAPTELGGFWSLTRPTGPLQAQLDGAILSEWNNFTNAIAVRVPAGTRMFEGVAGPQVSPLTGQSLMGGGSQVIFPQGFTIPEEWVVARATLQ